MITRISRKCAYLYRLISYRVRESLVFRSHNRADVFRNIHKFNYWNDSESVSGFGSTLKYTANVRRSIPEVITRFNISSIYDAPCGDFNWMRYVMRDQYVSYIGADIVPSLIKSNREEFSREGVQFFVHDIVCDDLPESDLMICRDCLFHLPETDIKAFFVNFVRSNIQYLLTTNHKNIDGFANSDIRIGGFRRIDLFLQPYGMPDEILYRFDDFIEPEPEREMILVHRDSIIEMVGNW